MQKINSFTNLIVWQEGHKLVLEIYKITNMFPSKENFGLISQMQRCAVSITSNIAEGFSRKSKKEKIQFYYISLGSITELQNQLLVARDLQYYPKDQFAILAQKTVGVAKLLNGLIRSINNKTS